MTTVITSVRNKIRYIKFNRPSKKNPVGLTEFQTLRNIISEDAKSNDTVGTVLTGEGDYFTSGNDMMVMLEPAKKKDGEYFKKFVENFKLTIDEFINYPKLLVAVVNGPAVGFGTSILGLCDMIYASDRATFQMPFAELGLNAEACSSYTFPTILGNHLTTQMIFGGRKLNVEEAKGYGLIQSVFEHEKVEEVYRDIVEKYAKLPLSIVKYNKFLIRENFRKELLECNKRECDILNVTMMSDEFHKIIKTFADRKKSKM